MPKTQPPIPAYKSLPHSLEAEKRVLGAMIRDRMAIAKVVIQVGLVPDDFYQPGHQKIFSCLVELHDQDKPIDLVVLHDVIDQKGEINQVGGAFYLTELVQNVVTSVNAVYHGLIVKQKSLLRRIIRSSAETEQEAYGEGDLEKIAAQIHALSLSIQNPMSRDDYPKKIGEFFEQVIDKTQQSIERITEGKSLKDISSGILDFDRKFGGFSRGELVIIGARPSEGKTALALWILGNVARMTGPVLLFSLEMNRVDIAARYLYANADFPFNASIKKSDASRLLKTAQILSEVDFYAVDIPHINIQQIRRHSEMFAVEQGNLAMVAIDYMTLIEETPGTHSRGDSAYRLYIQDISRQCKLLARHLNCVVLLLCQLNREIEKSKEWRKPRMSDLRESGAIEQDADVIVFPYRTEEVRKEDAGKRILSIDKNRNGPTGEIDLFFDPSTTRFGDFNWNGQEPPPGMDYREPGEDWE